MIGWLASPVTGVLLSIGAYLVGLWLRKKTGISAANPLAVASVLVSLAVGLGPMTLEGYMAGGRVISFFLLPATSVLALKIHSQWALFKKHAIPILAGCIAGSAASMASVYGLCRLFDLDTVLTASLLPKSVTSAIAMELSEKIGGIGSLTVSVVVLSGILCAMAAPGLIRTLRLKSPVASGVAIGVSGHAIGTARALEMGETHGAVGGIALTLAGVVTSLIYLVLY